jgi:hypothetical protein
MDIKYFPLDKNYILKEAQKAGQKTLLLALVEKVKVHYLTFYNPLGLEDDPILKIKNYKPAINQSLETFYHNLAGIYRYKFGNNQLEFIFDGRSHFEKYSDDWAEMFETWTNEFCRHENFLKAILEATVFASEVSNLNFIPENRMKAFVTRYFEIKITKQRGLPVFKIA